MRGIGIGTRGPGRAAKWLGLAAAALGASLTSTAALAAYGYATPGEIGFQSPVTDLARYLQWFHNDILLPIIIAHFAVRARAAGLCRLALQREGEPDSVEDDAQHADRGGSGRSCRSSFWCSSPSRRSACLTMQLVVAAGRSDGEGDGFAVALELRLSEGRGRLQFRLLHEGRQGSEAGRSSPARGRQRSRRAGQQDRSSLEITATDVIHSFIVQSFGVRIDAVPGRLNETWFKADREGVYYGQCSKICGKDHAFMPIAFRVVSEEQYEAWLADAKKKFASAERRR